MKPFLLVLILLPVILAGCPSPGPVMPAPDASDASARADAPTTTDLGTQVCDHLAAIGCKQPSTCATTFNRVEGKLTEIKPKCLLAASNALEANTCGTIRCGDGG